MHIDRVYVRAIQAAREIEIISAGQEVVELAGANEAGKSTTMDAVTYALCGAAGVNPDALRHGEADGEVTVEVGDLTITRRFKGPGKGRLTIKPSGGQRDLDALYSAFSFSPLDIATRRPGEGAAAFRKRVVAALSDLAGPDFRSALAMADGAIAEAEADRRDANRDLAKCGTLEPVPEPGEPPEDPGALQQQLREAADWNQEQRDRIAAHQRHEDQQRRAEELVTDLESRLEAARAALKAIAAKDPGPLPEPERDEDVLRQRLAAVADARVAASKYEDYQRALEDRANVARAAADAEQVLKERRLDRAEVLASADLPLPGITWDEDDVQLEGVSWEALSTGRRWRTAVDLAIAANERAGRPMRVIFIREGSLIDRKNFADITEAARSEGYQIWVESVQPHTDTAYEIEEGRVTRSPDAF